MLLLRPQPGQTIAITITINDNYKYNDNYTTAVVLQ